MSKSRRKKELLRLSTHPPDFHELAVLYPEFGSNVQPGRRVDFSSPATCKSLTQVCLRHYLEVEYWDIPQGYLCPPLPQRVNYVKWVWELVGGRTVTLLDM